MWDGDSKMLKQTKFKLDFHIQWEKISLKNEGKRRYFQTTEAVASRSAIHEILKEVLRAEGK